MITGSDPVYYVMTNTTKGRLEKRMTSRRTRQSSSSSSGRRGKPASGKSSSSDGRKRKKTGVSSRPPSYVDEAVLNFTHNDVINHLIIYQPMSPPTGSDLVLHDKFTFVLTSRNAQPVVETADIAIVSPPLPSTPSPPSSPSPPDDALGMSGHVSTPDARAAGVSVASDASDRSGRNHVIIVIIVAVLTVLVIVGIIVFKCVRRRRDAKRRKLELAAVIDATSSTAVSAPVASGGGGHPLQSPAAVVPASQPPTLPTAAQPEVFMTVGNSSGGPRPPPSRPTLPFSVPIIIEPPSSIADESSECPSAVETSQTPAGVPTSFQRDNRLPGTRSPPTLPGAEGPPQHPMQQRNGTTGSMGRGTGKPNAWKDQVTFDWQHVDPELLQHCRTTNPILHKNQYWV